MQIMVREHNMLHRQAIILKAATYPLNDKDRQRLKVTFPLPQPSVPVPAPMLLKVPARIKAMVHKSVPGSCECPPPVHRMPQSITPFRQHHSHLGDTEAPAVSVPRPGSHY